MNELVTVFGLCYNEEFMLPHFIAHYRKMFPECRIVLWDNESSDRSQEIALENNCEVVSYNTGGKLNDEIYLDLKNFGWKQASTPWVIVADIDEHLYLTQHDLEHCDEMGFTIIRSQGFNMVNLGDELDFNAITHGVRSESYDKSYCFKRTEIEQINYGPGCHHASPVGNINPSIETYPCLHYKYVQIDYMIARHAHYASRLSDANKRRGYGFHYKYPAEKIRKEFNEARKNAIKLL